MISIVAIANPAPLTRHPIFPPIWIYDKSNYLANLYLKFYVEISYELAISFYLKAALSSTVILASRAIILPSGERVIGLISIISASLLTKQLNKDLAVFTKSSTDALSVKPRFCEAATFNYESVGPFWRSVIGSLNIFDGSYLATSSMLTPPCGL